MPEKFLCQAILPASDLERSPHEVESTGYLDIDIAVETTMIKSRAIA
jgi:hypothetical protein